jgi:DNA-binding LytR/AlgR family response regulator
LALELRETRQLNEQLKNMTSKIPATQPSTANSQPSTLTLTGTTNDTVTLSVADLLYIETIGNYVKVYQLHDGQVCTDMLRATSKQMEEELQSYPMIVRCHRAFLVNLQQVEQIASQSGTMQLLIKHSHDTVPVSRSNMAGVKAAIRESVL